MAPHELDSIVKELHKQSELLEAVFHVLKEIVESIDGLNETMGQK